MSAKVQCPRCRTVLFEPPPPALYFQCPACRVTMQSSRQQQQFPPNQAQLSHLASSMHGMSMSEPPPQRAACAVCRGIMQLPPAHMLHPDVNGYAQVRCGSCNTINRVAWPNQTSPGQPRLDRIDSVTSSSYPNAYNDPSASQARLYQSPSFPHQPGPMPDGRSAEMSRPSLSDPLALSTGRRLPRPGGPNSEIGLTAGPPGSGPPPTGGSNPLWLPQTPAPEPMDESFRSTESARSTAGSAVLRPNHAEVPLGGTPVLAGLVKTIDNGKAVINPGRPFAPAGGGRVGSASGPPGVPQPAYEQQHQARQQYGTGTAPAQPFGQTSQLAQQPAVAGQPQFPSSPPPQQTTAQQALPEPALVQQPGAQPLPGLMAEKPKGFLRFLDKLLKPEEEYEMDISVNGRPVPDADVKKAESKAGPIEAGEYWYDVTAGFWGMVGGPTQGIIMPGISELYDPNFPLKRDASRGNTGVVINGRELTQKDLEVLTSRNLPTHPAAYWLDINGDVKDDRGQLLMSLGALAPSVLLSKKGFGMRPPEPSNLLL